MSEIHFKEKDALLEFRRGLRITCLEHELAECEQWAKANHLSASPKAHFEGAPHWYFIPHELPREREVTVEGWRTPITIPFFGLTNRTEAEMYLAKGAALPAKGSRVWERGFSYEVTEIEDRSEICIVKMRYLP